MAKHKAGEKPNFPPHGDMRMMSADVPVIIAFMHGDETHGEYEDIIHLTFTQKTPEGRQLAQRLRLLTTLDGQPLEGALFTIASEEVQARTVEFMQTHAQTDFVKRASAHALHIQVMRNGDI